MDDDPDLFNTESHLEAPLGQDWMHPQRDESATLSLVDGDPSFTADGGVHETIHEHFNPSHHDNIVGSPGSDVACWHLQHSSDTCAVASQEFILDELGLKVSEEALVHLAETRGVYSIGNGTPMYQTGSLLEAFGLPVVRETHASYAELVQRLAHGDKIIVGVDAHRIWHDNDRAPLDGSVLSAGSANHAIQVIGVQDPHGPHPMVIINDPGAPDGRGMMISENDFMEAWGASSNFLVAVQNGSTHGPSLQPVFDFPAINGLELSYNRSDQLTDAQTLHHSPFNDLPSERDGVPLGGSYQSYPGSAVDWYRNSDGSWSNFWRPKP